MENKKVLKLTDFQKNEENPFMKQAIEGIENHVVKKYKSTAPAGGHLPPLSEGRCAGMYEVGGYAVAFANVFSSTP